MYCTIQDLKEQVSELVLINLTDDEGVAPAFLDEAGENIINRLNKAILDATNEINGYCQARYPVPLNPVPGFIAKLAVDIALYNLFSRRGFFEDNQDKAIVDRYRAAVKNLENIARGVVTLGAVAPSPSPGSGDVAQISSSPRIFSRKKMEGF